MTAPVKVTIPGKGYYGDVDVTVSGLHNVVVTVQIVTRGASAWQAPPARVLRRMAQQYAASIGRTLTSDRRDEDTNGGPVGQWRFVYRATVAEAPHIVDVHVNSTALRLPGTLDFEHAFPTAQAARAWADESREKFTDRTFTVRPKWQVSRDGQELTVVDTEDAAYHWLLKHQGQSTDYALRHGGYAITPVTP